MKRKILVVLILLFIVNIIVTFSDKYGFSCESISRTDLYSLQDFQIFADATDIFSQVVLLFNIFHWRKKRQLCVPVTPKPPLPTLTQTSHTLTQTSQFSLKLFSVSKSVHNLPLYCTFSLVK